MYRSNEMAHKFSIDDVEHMTSNAIQVSQNSAPNIQYPAKGGHKIKTNNIKTKNHRTPTF